MAREITIPFMLDVHGKVSTTTDPDTQVMQHVRSLVQTNPGERVMRPDYGVPLSRYVYEPDNNVGVDIERQVTMQMNKWEPGVNLLGITPITVADLGVVDVEIDFQRQAPTTGAPSSGVVTILVGGSLVDGGTS